MALRVFGAVKNMDIYYEDLQTKFLRNRQRKLHKTNNKRSPYSRFAQKHFDNDSGFIGAY